LVPVQRPPCLTRALEVLTEVGTTGGVSVPAVPGATIVASYLFLLARYAESRCLSTQVTHGFLRRAGLTPSGEADEPERRVSIESLYALWALCVRELDDPSLPIGYALRLRIEDHHLLGFTAMSCPTGAEALEVLTRHSRLASDSGAWTLETQPEALHLVWQRPGERTLGQRLANEAVLAEVVAALRQIFPGTEPLAVELRHSAPADARAHRRFFGVDLRWSSDRDALVFHPRLARLRPTTENASLAAYFAREAARRARQLPASTLTAQVERAIGDELAAHAADGGPGLDLIARRLSLSPSHLRELLRRERSSFRQLLDTARRERASALLQKDDLSISEIALRLGFSETSAFTRAHTRWHGVPPRDQRKRL
jgi:AraC-like DNA-binding protein